ncbi:MAG: beta-galactosidase trimerization domain-containing protein [Bacteroidota bacterium]
MKDKNGNWDFSLFDHAFRAADKYGISLYATLFPETEKTDLGGFKYPKSEVHLKSIANFIKALTTHFSTYKSLFGWVLINEPCRGGNLPQDEYTEAKFQEWLQKNPQPQYGYKGYPILVELSREHFALEYQTWFQKWLADEIKKYDTEHDLHINPHNIFNNVTEIDFPSWRNYLTSLGGSAHAGWHFREYGRHEFPVAMSATSEIIYNGSGSLPWLMTEVQGGNNTYSANTPMCPTKEEIAQWLWIIYGTEGKGAIFWTLNPRASGIEAGEWALVDYQNNPTDRLLEIKKIGQTIEDHKELFGKARKVDSGIHLLYIHESIWGEKRMIRRSNDNEALQNGATIKSLLGYFNAFSSLGVSPNILEIGQFDFSKENYEGETIVLAHQIAVPTDYRQKLEHFVEKGGKLIVDGLTAFYDEDMINTMQLGFQFEQLLGGNISEYKVVQDTTKIKLGNYELSPMMWQGYPVKTSGNLLMDGENAVGLRNVFGDGETLWIPTLLGLAEFSSKTNKSVLAPFLLEETKASLARLPVKYIKPYENVLMKTLISDGQLITTMINKNKNPLTVELDFKKNTKLDKVIYGKNSTAEKNNVLLAPEETKVLIWEK